MARKRVKWWKGLNPKEVAEAYSESVVDAYGEHEEHSGLLTMIEDELKFPFPGRLLGDVVQIVGMECPDHNSFGLDLVCEKNGDKYSVDAGSVDLVEPLPVGCAFLAAYLDWRGSL